MNKKGFTLLELLMAAAILLITLSSFSYMLKISAGCVKRANKLSKALCLARSRMEEIWQVTPSSEVSAIQIGVGNIRLYSLRSKY